MKHRWFRSGIVFMMVMCLSFASQQVNALADAVIEDEDESFDRYIAFGQDLKKSEKSKVMEIFDITKSELKEYKTIEITNKQEHQYLGDYIAASVIGKRALSSVMVVKTEEGSGVHVDTENISYCTPGMYCNALVTAGIKDADVKVAGPFKISGTSALVGAMKAYETMTGEDIDEDTMDTAANELVVTSSIAEKIGDPEKIEQLMAAVKEKVVEEDLDDAEDIKEVVEKAADELDVDLSDKDVDKIAGVMEKVSDIDIDIDSIKKQAGDIYNKLKESGIDLGEIDGGGIWDSISDFFAKIGEAIAGFFKGLF